MTKFITLVSGKGGVGKTTATINIGHALHELGKKVVLLDGNITTPNVALHLGLLKPKGTLNKFLRKEKSLKQVTYEHESGLKVIPACPSYEESVNSDADFSKIFESLDNTADFVLVDAPSGLGSNVEEILAHTDEVVLVVTPTLSSVMDALKTIELAKEYKNTVAGAVLNMSNKGKHELSVQEVQEILGCAILGNVRLHSKVRKSLHKQHPATHLYPKSKVAKEFANVARFLALE